MQKSSKIDPQPIHAHAHTHAYTHAHAHAHAYALTHMHMHTCTHTCTCTHAHTHAHAHMYMHTCTCTCMCTHMHSNIEFLWVSMFNAILFNTMLLQCIKVQPRAASSAPLADTYKFKVCPSAISAAACRSSVVVTSISSPS